MSRVGIEPTTDALKGRYSTTELPARISHCTLRGMDGHCLDRCLGVILDATSGVTPEAATKRVGDRWSVVEIVEHLLGAFTLDQWLRFHLVHTKHHEKQIRARR